MTTPSNARSSRFRQVTTVPTTPEEQIEALLDNGPRLYQRIQELLLDRGRAGDIPGMVALAHLGARAHDPKRAYAVQRLVASTLVELADAGPRQFDLARRGTYDQVVGLLVPWMLENDPHDPELLLLLARALRGLGDSERTARMMDVIEELEPEQADARRRFVRSRGTDEPRSRASFKDAPSLHKLGRRLDALIETAPRLADQTISLCMIVKDEESMLGDCLESVRGYVDEIIVVDTGSSDRTIEIARSHDATVIEFPWNGSFSDARNVSLEHATSDWILWLDADERIVDGDGPRLREMTRRTWAEGLTVIETHFLGDGRGETSAMHEPMRVFRNRQGEYYFKGTIHEQIAWSLPTWLAGRVQRSMIRVDHFGYLAEVVESRDKIRRNLNLLLEEHKDMPSAFNAFNIGTEYGQLSNWEEAVSWFEQSLDQLREAGPDDARYWNSVGFAPLLFFRAASARHMCMDYEGAIELAAAGLEIWPEHTDLVLQQARAYIQLGDWDQAEERSRTALTMGDAPASFFAVTGKGTFQARQTLAHALAERGETEEAIQHLTVALEEQPRYEAAVTHLISLLLDSDRTITEVDATLTDLFARTGAGSARSNLLIGSNLHHFGEFEAAEEWYRRVLDIDANHGAALVALSELKLAQGDLLAAWEHGMAIDERDRFHSTGAQSSVVAAAALGRSDLFVRAAERLEHSNALAASERALYAAWHNIIEPNGARSMIPPDEFAQQTLLRNMNALVRLEATEAYEALHGLVDQVIPDTYQRGILMAKLYLDHSFADMAGEELMALAQTHGPDAAILTGLGKVATIKQMWDDALVFLDESLNLHPHQPEARRLKAAIEERLHA